MSLDTRQGCSCLPGPLGPRGACGPRCNPSRGTCGCPTDPKGPEGPRGPVKWKNHVTFLTWDTLRFDSECVEAARKCSKKHGGKDISNFATFLETALLNNKPTNLGLYSTLLGTVLREISYKQIAEVLIAANLIEGQE